MPAVQPTLQGEDYIRRQAEFEQAFVDPPGAPSQLPSRNTLVVGGLGAGKTMLLLRYRSQVPGAIYLQLPNILGRLNSTRLPHQPYVQDAESRITLGQAVFALCQGIATQAGLHKRPGDIANSDHVRSTFPSDRLVEGLTDRPSVVHDIDRDQFSEVDIDSSAIQGVLRDFAEMVGQPLTILIDQTDPIAPLLLVPVLGLLGRGAAYRVVVAMRPGQVPVRTAWTGANPRPYDDYQILPIGHAPWGHEWQDFARKVTAPLLDGMDFALRETVEEYAPTMARDSLRYRMMVIDNLQQSSGPDLTVLQRVLNSLAVHHRNQIVNQHWAYGNVQAIRSGLRSHFRRDAKVLLPADLFLIDAGEPGVSSDPNMQTRLQRFIDDMLKYAGFAMRNGDIWVPGCRPQEVEVHPLLLWGRDTTLANWPKYSELSSGNPIALHSSSLAKRIAAQDEIPKSIFVSLRFSSDARTAQWLAQQFRRDLMNYDAWKRWRATDEEADVGIGPPVAWGGEGRRGNWWGQITEMIREAHFLLAFMNPPDIEEDPGVRAMKEVLFEIGYAIGSGVPVIPAAREDAFARLPTWLTDQTVLRYAHQGARDGFLSSVEENFSELADPMTRMAAIAELPVETEVMSGRGAVFATCAVPTAIEQGLIDGTRRLPDGVTYFGLRGETWPDWQGDRLLEAFMEASRSGLIVLLYGSSDGDQLLDVLAGIASAKQVRPGGAYRRIVLSDVRELAPSETQVETRPIWPSMLEKNRKMVKAGRPARVQAWIQEYVTRLTEAH